MIRYFSFPSTISLTCFLLVSCATLEQPVEEKQQAVSEPVGWQAEKRERQQIGNWEIRGRLGLQTAHNGGTMDLVWKQAGDDFTIHLIAPLGAGSYMIQGGKDFAEIRFPDGEKQVIDDVDKVFSSVLEVDLPASAIKDWVRGLPASELSVESVDWNSHGLINRVKQGGWNIEMNKYAGPKVLLPHNIFVSREDDADIDVRMILRQWLVDN